MERGLCAEGEFRKCVLHEQIMPQKVNANGSCSVCLGGKYALECREEEEEDWRRWTHSNPWHSIGQYLRDYFIIGAIVVTAMCPVPVMLAEAVQRKWKWIRHASHAPRSSIDNPKWCEPHYSPIVAPFALTCSMRIFFPSLYVHFISSVRSLPLLECVAVRKVRARCDDDAHSMIQHANCIGQCRVPSTGWNKRKKMKKNAAKKLCNRIAHHLQCVVLCADEDKKTERKPKEIRWKHSIRFFLSVTRSPQSISHTYTRSAIIGSTKVCARASIVPSTLIIAWNAYEMWLRIPAFIRGVFFICFDFYFFCHDRTRSMHTAHNGVQNELKIQCTPLTNYYLLTVLYVTTALARRQCEREKNVPRLKSRPTSTFEQWHIGNRQAQHAYLCDHAIGICIRNECDANKNCEHKQYWNEMSAPLITPVLAQKSSNHQLYTAMCHLSILSFLYTSANT